MYIRNRFFCFAYKVVFMLMCVGGVVAYLYLPHKSWNPLALVYYPVILGLLCAIYYLCASISCLRDIIVKSPQGLSSFAMQIKYMLLVSSLLSIAVFFYIGQNSAPLSVGEGFLVPQAYYPAPLLANIILHLLVPAGILVDYLLFDRKGRLLFSDILSFFVFPIIYYIGLTLLSLVDFRYKGSSRYPYSFIDPSDIRNGGWEQVIINLLILAGVYLVVGLLFFALDRILSLAETRKTTRNNTAPPVARKKSDTSDLSGNLLAETFVVSPDGDSGRMATSVNPETEELLQSYYNRVYAQEDNGRGARSESPDSSHPPFAAK